METGSSSGTLSLLSLKHINTLVEQEKIEGVVFLPKGLQFMIFPLRPIIHDGVVSVCLQRDWPLLSDCQNLTHSFGLECRIKKSLVDPLLVDECSKQVSETARPILYAKRTYTASDLNSIWEFEQTIGDNVSPDST